MNYPDLAFKDNESQTRKVELIGPLTDEKLQRIDPACRQVHFYHNAFSSDEDFNRIAEAMQRCPAAKLRVWGGDRKNGCGLAFLKCFRNLRSFGLDAAYSGENGRPFRTESGHWIRDN